MAKRRSKKVRNPNKEVCTYEKIIYIFKEILAIDTVTRIIHILLCTRIGFGKFSVTFYLKLSKLHSCNSHEVCIPLICVVLYTASLRENQKNRFQIVNVLAEVLRLLPHPVIVNDT